MGIDASTTMIDVGPTSRPAGYLHAGANEINLPCVGFSCLSSPSLGNSFPPIYSLLSPLYFVLLSTASISVSTLPRFHEMTSPTSPTKRLSSRPTPVLGTSFGSDDGVFYGLHAIEANSTRTCPAKINAHEYGAPTHLMSWQKNEMLEYFRRRGYQALPRAGQMRTDDLWVDLFVHVWPDPYAILMGPEHVRDFLFAKLEAAINAKSSKDKYDSGEQFQVNWFSFDEKAFAEQARSINYWEATRSEIMSSDFAEAERYQHTQETSDGAVCIWLCL